MDIAWITVVGVLATSASLAVLGLTLVMASIAQELKELNAHLRSEVASKKSVGYSRRDSPSGTDEGE